MEPTVVEIPLWMKALQLFALASFFGGSFHVVRLFVAHREAMGKWEPDRTILTKQFSDLERRALYFLNWPMLIVFLSLGVYVLWQRPELLQRSFIQVLFGYFALLTAYQVVVHRLHLRLKRGEATWSTFQLRAWVSVATLFLFTLVVLLIYREEASWVWGSIGLLVVGGVIILAVSALRKNSSTEKDDA